MIEQSKIEKIKTLFSKGLEPKDIAEIVGVTSPTVMKYGNNGKKWEEIQKQRILKMIENDVFEAIFQYAETRAGKRIEDSEFLDTLDLNELKKEKENPQVYLAAAGDYYILFNYLMGRIKIRAGHMQYNGGENIYETAIDSVNDLFLLRRAEIGFGGANNEKDIERTKAKKTDKNLYRLMGAISYRSSKLHFINWTQQINEIGQYQKVRKHLFKPEEVRKYEARNKIKIKNAELSELINRCYSPNPLTFGHGGDRRSNVFP